jgi:hypothetical protein
MDLRELLDLLSPHLKPPAQNEIGLRHPDLAIAKSVTKSEAKAEEMQSLLRLRRGNLKGYRCTHIRIAIRAGDERAGEKGKLKLDKDNKCECMLQVSTGPPG